MWRLFSQCKKYLDAYIRPRQKLTELEQRIDLLETLLLPKTYVTEKSHYLALRENRRLLLRSGLSAPDIGWLKESLRERGLELQRMHEVRGYDGLLEYIAVYIGTRGNMLKPLLSAMHNLNASDRSFDLHIERFARIQQTTLTQFCAVLYNLGVFEAYSYDNEAKLITVSVAADGTYYQFFNGGWFERWVVFLIRDVIADIRQTTGAQILSYPNVELRFPDGTIREIDCLILSESSIYWIECKSGEIDAGVKALRELISSYGIVGCELLLILGSNSWYKVQRVSEMSGLRVFGERKLRKNLRVFLSGEVASCETHRDNEK